VIRDVYVHSSPTWTGISFLYVTNALVQNITASDFSEGIRIEASSNVNITDNTISSSQEGIHLYNCRYTAISNNKISASTSSALWIVVSTNITITSNEALNNEAGITVSSSKYINIANDLVSRSGTGVWLEYSGNVSVVGNTISNSFGDGVYILSSSEPIRTYHNNFVNNKIQAYVVAYFPDNGTHTWDNGYPSGGNYWSDYNGVDHCSGSAQNICGKPDGIGDTAYYIDALNLDHYPLIYPWGPREASPPSWPGGTTLTAFNLGPFSLSLNWTSAIDDTWVAKYRVYQGSNLVAEMSSSIQSYSVNGVLPATAYFFRVEAGDPWNNWSTEGPSLNVTTPDIPPLPPPEHGAILFYRLKFVHQVRQGEPLNTTNEFWNLGDTSLMITGVTVTSDLGTFSLLSSNQQYPTICGAYSGALGVGVGQGQTLKKSIVIPTTASTGNHTLTVSVEWQYLGLQQIYPNSTPIPCWFYTTPLSLQFWVEVQTGLRPPTSPNPPSSQSPGNGPSTSNPSTQNLVNWIGSRLPLALGIYLILVVSVVFFLVRARKRAGMTRM